MTPLIIISIMATRRRSVGVEISYQLAILVFLWKQIFVSLVSLLFCLRVSSDPVLLSSQRGQGWQGWLLLASIAPASSWVVTRTVTRSLSPCTSVSMCHYFRRTTIVKMAGLTGQGLMTWSANLWHLRKVKVYWGWLRRWPAWPQCSPPLCTPGQNRFLAAQSDSGAGGDNLSLARLSRYLLMPGTPVHGTRERPERERGQRRHCSLASGPLGTAADWAFCTKGTHFTLKRKYVILGRDYHVRVWQRADGREGCEGFTIIGFNGPEKCQSRKPKSAHFLSLKNSCRNFKSILKRFGDNHRKIWTLKKNQYFKFSIHFETVFCHPNMMGKSHGTNKENIRAIEFVRRTDYTTSHWHWHLQGIGKGGVMHQEAKSFSKISTSARIHS